jgi:hypothetical protein
MRLFQRRNLPLLFLALPVIPAICTPVRVTPPPATASAREVALAGAAVLIGVGDIADCGSDGDEGTARIVDSVLKADSVAKVEDAVFTLGDNAYPVGSVANFAQCWGSSWGDPKKGIMGKIRPTPGNHEHETDMAAPYYLYFKERAGDPQKGYYSYDLGEWHVIALNSAIAVQPIFRDADRRAQEEWLRKDLADHPAKCTIAYWHHPRWSSGYHGNDSDMGPIMQILYDANADVVLVGHDHHYERFAPLNPAGVIDTARGITQILAGTGGGHLRGLRRGLARNSLVRIQGHFGVLKLTLGAGEYRHAFLDTQGRVWDTGGGKCH